MAAAAAYADSGLWPDSAARGLSEPNWLCELSESSGLASGLGGVDSGDGSVDADGALLYGW